MEFTGDFSLLPFAANVRYGAVPEYPTEAQFHAAVSLVGDDLPRYAEAHWYIEAIRERRLNPGRLLDEAAHDINRRVAKRLYDLIVHDCEYNVTETLRWGAEAQRQNDRNIALARRLEEDAA